MVSDDPEAVTREVTLLLSRLRAGDADAGEDLARRLSTELRRIAGALLGRPGASPTLQATELVNEAWMKLFADAGGRADYEGRRHFFSVAAKAMRSILVDRARRRQSLKRSGSGERVPLDAVVAAAGEDTVDLVALDEALSELAFADERAAKVVELRFFAGLSNEEVAETMGIGLRTVERSWRSARAWLAARLQAD